ncbi:MAG: OmpA family protein [Gemmatimonadota bacterium]|nr:OmpA family protein [Gemmatimonadota bacterium]MDH3427181.1 OmpA family protein [Gemmatimonadota bacterium]
MKNFAVGSRPLAVGFATFVAFAASGCAAKVNQDVYNADIAAIRADIAGLDSRATLTEEQLAQIQSRMDGLEAELGVLREEFDVTVARLETGIRFATPIHFDFDDATIRTVDMELLDRFVDVVSHHFEGALITVEGFADPAGSMAYNQRLSERRAGAVADYVRSVGGLDRAQIKTIGYGETRLVEAGAQGPGEAGLVNRRVAFVIDYAPEVEVRVDPEDLVADAQAENETT